MGGKILAAGLVIGGACPTVALFAIGTYEYLPLLLLASALFFFTSCTANFHWAGG
jgi:hypothetical protein